MKVAVVIPAFQVRDFILDVLSRIDDSVFLIVVVDDCCPERTGEHVRQHTKADRVIVVRNGRNMGVGGATLVGFRRALDEGAEIIVKIDGDGQHRPEWIPQFTGPVSNGKADVAKGNRFYDVGDVVAMPKGRLLANLALSFLAKLSTGYWDVFDPANGLFAVHRKVASRLPMARIARRYFFETDLLFHLNLLQAKVLEVPMEAIYGQEPSGVRPWREALYFLARCLRNAFWRVLYSYYLRGFSVASLMLAMGLALVVFGTGYGIANWGGPATPGTVMVAGLPFLVGSQMLIAFLTHDMSRQPEQAIHPRLFGDGGKRHAADDSSELSRQAEP